uniref:Chloride channel protein n=1 Tax=Odontella aurita TaxID=265563 RepID=A0A7S4JVC3_9STRA
MTKLRNRTATAAAFALLLFGGGGGGPTHLIGMAHGFPLSQQRTSASIPSSLTTTSPPHLSRLGNGSYARLGPILSSAVSVRGGGGGDGGHRRHQRNEIRDDESNILGAAVAVGAVTAAMGYAYGQILGFCVDGVWTKLPLFLSSRLLAANGIALNPRYFITGTLALGGLLVGIVSSRLKSPAYTVADFVSAFAAVPAEARELPRSRTALLPLLVLSLITSSFGFSVGPEAPMVCAGGLVGTSIARKLYRDDRADSDSVSKAREDEGDGAPSGPPGFESKGEAAFAEHLAYAGAAGALTAFMGIPVAGSIFALELTRSGAGLSSGARDALSPSIAASVAAIAVIRALLSPDAAVGGHFSYGTILGDAASISISGRDMMIAAVGCGVGGALIGTVFHKGVALMKKALWPAPKEEAKAASAAAASGGTKKGGGAWKRTVLTKTLVGLAVGLLSSSFPQTLFWGEGSLQCAVDGQATPFGSTKHGLPSLLTSLARVDPSLPFPDAASAASVGCAKLLSIALACAGKFPGGIIFPLFFAAAPFAHAASLAGLWTTNSGVLPVAVMSLMASTQASVTRTPLATALILTLSASGGTPISVMLPACLVSSYLGVYVSQILSRQSYFSYTK